MRICLIIFSSERVLSRFAKNFVFFSDPSIHIAFVLIIIPFNLYSLRLSNLVFAAWRLDINSWFKGSCIIFCSIFFILSFISVSSLRDSFFLYVANLIDSSRILPLISSHFIFGFDSELNSTISLIVFFYFWLIRRI